MGEFNQDWALGSSLVVAVALLALWYLGRPALRFLKFISRILKRIAAAIGRFFQPIFEFMYRSIYVLFHVAVAIGLGAIATMPLWSGEQMDMMKLVEAGAAALVVLGLTVIIFRHFKKYPLRAGEAHKVGDATSNLDEDSFNEDLEFDIEI